MLDSGGTHEHVCCDAANKPAGRSGCTCRSHEIQQRLNILIWCPYLIVSYSTTITMISTKYIAVVCFIWIVASLYNNGVVGQGENETSTVSQGVNGQSTSTVLTPSTTGTSHSTDSSTTTTPITSSITTTPITSSTTTPLITSSTTTSSTTITPTTSSTATTTPSASSSPTSSESTTSSDSTSTSTPKATSPATTHSSSTSSTTGGHKSEEKSSGQSFDGASFIGGIVLCAGLIAIVFFGLKFYRARKEQSYRTL